MAKNSFQMIANEKSIADPNARTMSNISSKNFSIE
tara:strand:+ start:1637 stop:1741 length:105 start_codon:yes stop_codon:yes gene_type:complete